jgi:type IV pilus assembly protein PilA
VGANGLITALFSSAAPTNTNIQGASLILSPLTAGGSIAWTCTKSTVKPTYLPSSCRK